VGAVGAEWIEAVRRRIGERGLVILLPLLLGTSYVALGSASLTFGLSILALHALVNGIYSPLSKDLLNREITDSSQRATVLSVESMARRLVFGAFAPIGGVLIDHHGLGAGLQLTGAVGVVGAGAMALLFLGRGTTVSAGGLVGGGLTVRDGRPTV
jgi:hypothetical protein